ncbi:MAG TPA: glycosyltransferase family 39 protein [Anaerolineae bacterium]|nr:glycosyltransferase family 39 protein [Anaerolineae bacterium]
MELTRAVIRQQRLQQRWPWLALAAIVLLALWARWGYFTNGDPFVDEWATMVAARSVWERGVPILPSGIFYGHGILFTYLDALFLGLFGWTAEVAQAPSLVAGLAAVVLAYLVGRRLFAPRAGETLVAWRGEAVGLLAAALLALDPVAIIWAGRARAYTLQQGLVLLAVLLLYRRRTIAFALAFAAAVLAHTESALLLPGFALGLWLLEGRGVLRNARAWLAMGIAGAAVVAQLLVYRFIATGNAGRFEVVDDVRPGFQLSLDLVAGFRPLVPYFAEPNRLVVTLFALFGLLLAVRAWRRREGADGYLLLYPLFLAPLLILLTVIGQSWKDPRYLFMLLPVLFLLASAAAVDLLASLWTGPARPAWPKALAGAGLAALLLGPMLPAALKTAHQLEEGYGPTLAYVREQLQAGDQVAGWAAPAISVELGRIDYFAMQIRHEEFIMKRDGVWIDRWVGAPLLDSVEHLGAALDRPGRLWFLADEYRFIARYTPEFRQAIWDRMDPVYRYHYAIAFLERPAGEPAYRRDVQIGFERGLDLVGYDLSPAALEPGGELTLALHWTAREWVDAPYTVFVHLLDPSGGRVAQDDGPPLDGLHATDHWVPGERLRDERRLVLPGDAEPGRYRVEVGWYDPVTLARVPLLDGRDSLWLATLPLGLGEVADPGTRVGSALDGQAELAGYDLWRLAGGQWLPLGAGEPLSAGDRLKVRLVWQTLAEMDIDYTTFVHLEGADGAVWGQHDGPPAGGTYPTSHWRAGERVAEEHELTVGEAASGAVRLSAGMYRLETMERLGEAIQLLQLEVVP